MNENYLYYKDKEWKNILCQMNEETIGLKNELSALLRLHQDYISLEKAEFFNNLFMQEDERILFLRAVVSYARAEISVTKNENDADIKDGQRKMEMVDKAINNAQQQFAALKKDFYNCILSVARYRSV